MLKPIEVLSKYATHRGLTEALYERKRAALSAALLNPLLSDAEDETVVAVYAHGPVATRVIGDGRDFYVQTWDFGNEDWIMSQTFTGDAVGRSAAMLHARDQSGKRLSPDELREKWAALNSADDEDINKRLASREDLAEFWYDQQAAGWDDNDPFLIWTRVAETAIANNSIPSGAYDDKWREKIDTALANLASAWGELPSVGGIVVDGSPRYLASLFADNTPIHVAGGKATRKEGGARSWLSGEHLAKIASEYHIDRASAPSPSAAEYIWWFASEPVKGTTHRTVYTLHVHAVLDGGQLPREPVAEDYQRIADVLGIEFEQPLTPKPPRGVVINHSERGIYLGNCMGMGFWSKLDPAGQDAAAVFPDAVEAKKHMAGWDGGEPSGVTFVEVDADMDSGRYASVAACTRAGLPAWDVERHLEAPTL